jgi:Fic family protein
LNMIIRGNGRVHRYLVHHVLAGKGFGTPGIVFTGIQRLFSACKPY